MNPVQEACLQYINDYGPVTVVQLATAGKVNLCCSRAVLGYLYEMAYITYDVPTKTYTITAAGIAALGS